MDSRERVRRTLNRERADRIPVDFWASKGAIRSIERSFGMSIERFLDVWDVDIRYIPGPRYVGPPLLAGCDLWGVRRTSVELSLPHGTEVYEDVLEAPLAAAASPDDVEAYDRWPSPDWYDYSGIAAQCESVRASGRVAVFMGDRLNRIAQLKPAMYLRGVEGILVDMLEAPEVASAVIGRIRRFYAEYLARILEAARGGIDIVLTGDDFGSQRGLLISRELWGRFIGPGFREYIEQIHAYGAVAMHHTCGAVSEVIPDLIDARLDVLQSLQPEASGMDLRGLCERYGSRLAFQGGLSIQRTLPRGTPADVRAEVAAVAAIMRPAGGYIFGTAHNIQADTPMANVRALMEAYRDLGRS